MGAAQSKRVTFVPTGPFVVRRPFQGEGDRRWQPGEAFPVDAAKDLRRLKVMFTANMITMAPPEESKAPAPVKPPAKGPPPRR